MNVCDNAHEKIESNAVAGLQTWSKGFWTYAGHTRLLVGFVCEPIVHVVRQLTVDTNRLQSFEYSVARSFQHLASP